jgi:hypothetical protein
MVFRQSAKYNKTHMKITFSIKSISTYVGILAALFVPFAFASALTIAPARVEIAGDPGQTISGEYLLINEQQESKTFYSTFENFEAQGETGTPNFVTATEGLATWIDSPSTITLGPGESQKLKYSITIPSNAQPGGHFAAIFWGTTDPRQSAGDEQVTIGAKIGVLVLLRVNGDIAEGGGVVEFSTKDSVRFFTMLPIDFVYRFANDGGDRIKPQGTVTIKNTFGFTTDVFDANPQDGNVLPGSVRKYDIAWTDIDPDDEKKDEKTEMPEGFVDTLKFQMSHFALGMYRAKIDLAYGQNEELVSSASFMFFVFPWQLMLVMVLIIVALWRGLKEYNKMIIRKAQQAVHVQSQSTKKTDDNNSQ